MSNKTQLQNPPPANGDDVPQTSNLNQFQQVNAFDDDHIPYKTRLGNSQINFGGEVIQQQQQNQVELQPIQQPISILQNQAIQQRFSNYELIQKKKQLEQQAEQRNNEIQLDDDQLEQKKIEQLIILAPNKPYSIEPQFLKCEKCQKASLSEVQYKAGWGSILVCFLLLFTPAFFLFPLPFCKRKCKDAHHYCQFCHNKIGTYSLICE